MGLGWVEGGLGGLLGCLALVRGRGMHYAYEVLTNIEVQGYVCVCLGVGLLPAHHSEKSDLQAL